MTFRPWMYCSSPHRCFCSHTVFAISSWPLKSSMTQNIAMKSWGIIRGKLCLIMYLISLNLLVFWLECRTISNRPQDGRKKDTIRIVNENPRREEFNIKYESPRAGSSAFVSSNNNNNIDNNAWDALRLSTLVINGVGIRLQKYGPHIFETIVDMDSFRETLLSLADHFSEKAIRFLLTLLEEFMKTMWDEMESFMECYIPSESVLDKLGRTILDRYRDRSLQYIKENKEIILKSVKDYFMSMNPNFRFYPRKCTICSGYYNICRLWFTSMSMLYASISISYDLVGLPWSQRNESK